MKDFYREKEPIYSGEKENNYKLKREKVLQVIKPICETFEIKGYDYILNNEKERLVVEGQEIGCRLNSIGATVMELLNYIWINTVAKNKYFCFQKQCLNALKRYWIEE